MEQLFASPFYFQKVFCFLYYYSRTSHSLEQIFSYKDCVIDRLIIWLNAFCTWQVKTINRYNHCEILYLDWSLEHIHHIHHLILATCICTDIILYIQIRITSDLWSRVYIRPYTIYCDRRIYFCKLHFNDLLIECFPSRFSQICGWLFLRFSIFAIVPFI